MDYDIEFHEDNEGNENPKVVFALGFDGKTVILDIVNEDKSLRVLLDQIQEELENIADNFCISPGVYKWEFSWSMTTDPEGNQDVEFEPKDEETLFDYEEYKRSKG